MYKTVLLAVIICCFIGCQKQSTAYPKLGYYHGELQLSEGEVLPVNLRLFKNNADALQMETTNASEEVLFDEIQIINDSLHIPMIAFDGNMILAFKGEQLSGYFIEENIGRKIPFSAKFGQQERFTTSTPAQANVSGDWEVDFYSDTPEKLYKAKGTFSQNNNKVTGTFSTATGDYRFLEGVVHADSLRLGTFDGTHVYLFKAQVTDSVMKGKFYVGNHRVIAFSAKRNDAFELPDANALTYLKDETKAFNFSFPDTAGNMVSLSDARFKDKVTLVQIMGTWCPNCMDETRFYVDYLNANAAAAIEIVGLSFEYAKTEEKAINAIKRYQKKLGVKYPILLAQYGGVNKKQAQEKLPMLNKVISYPTTIFVDKQGVVRKIHTGFNGPATGEKYLEFKEDFQTTMDALLAE